MERLKLAVLSACSSGAMAAPSTLRDLGLGDAADQVDLADGADPGAPVGLARGMVEELGVAVLAMRYPIADGFAVGSGSHARGDPPRGRRRTR
ncbi:hypothetical protein ACTMTJ_17570 [Phytohabitans sp. LJ34]|uniref:hypothetical protein n=1 Tax=Phytohabitans sp. LJ34 TaxID=3452217 RepID=UPI003F8AB95B